MDKSMSVSLSQPHESAVSVSDFPRLSPELAAERQNIPTVYLDADLAESAALIQGAGWQARVFVSLAVFVQPSDQTSPSCLLVDLSSSGSEKLASHEDFAVAHPEMPVICIAGEIRLEAVVRIMKAGIFHILTKAVAKDMLLGVIESALQQSEKALKRDGEIRDLRSRYTSLSDRERQVMGLIVAGLLNKQVGYELGISEITVKAHRGSLMRKMQATSFASLVKMSTILGAQ